MLEAIPPFPSSASTVQKLVPKKSGRGVKVKAFPIILQSTNKLSDVTTKLNISPSGSLATVFRSLIAVVVPESSEIIWSGIFIEGAEFKIVTVFDVSILLYSIPSKAL